MEPDPILDADKLYDYAYGINPNFPEGYTILDRVPVGTMPIVVNFVHGEVHPSSPGLPPRDELPTNNNSIPVDHKYGNNTDNHCDMENLHNIDVLFQDPGGGTGNGNGPPRALPPPSHLNGLPPNVTSSRNRTSTASSSLFENCYAEIPSDSFRIHGPPHDLKAIEYMEKSLGSPNNLPGRYHPAIGNGSAPHQHSPDSGVGLNTSGASLKPRTLDEFDMYELQRVKKQQRKYVVLHVVVMALAGIAYIGVGIVAGYFIGQSYCSSCDILADVVGTTTQLVTNSTEEMTTGVEIWTSTEDEGWQTTEPTTTRSTIPTTTLPTITTTPSPYSCEQVGNLCACGPFGGTKGDEFSDFDTYSRYGNITGMSVRHNDYLIYGLQFIYGTQPGPQHGYTSAGVTTTIQLNTGEYFTHLDLDFTLGSQFLTRLSVKTSFRVVPYTYGGESGQRFFTHGAKLLYISGRDGPMVDQLTLYYDRCQ